MVGVDPLSHAPVLRGDALQEVVVHVEADAQREEREVLLHHPLHILLDGAQLDLACEESASQQRGALNSKPDGRLGESVLPTVGSPSDTRMTMETERGSMSPWEVAFTSIWAAFISASLMLVPGGIRCSRSRLHRTSGTLNSRRTSSLTSVGFDVLDVVLGVLDVEGGASHQIIAPAAHVVVEVDDAEVIIHGQVLQNSVHGLHRL